MSKTIIIDDTDIRQHRPGAGDPMYIHFTDDDMEADEVCMAGWVVEGKTGPLLVGTVISYRKGDEITRTVSHGHIYAKSLPGRKVTHMAILTDYRIGR